MIIYMSGPISNVVDYKEKFARAEKKIRIVFPEAKIVNPAKLKMPESSKHDDYMNIDYMFLDLADAIYLLDGWDLSKGARMEYRFAIDKGLEIMFENEIWKEIPGCDGNYMISNLGRVKSKERTYKSGRSYGVTRKNKEKVMKNCVGKSGYEQVTLTLENGKRKSFHIHRLVAEAFVPNNKKYTCVNHIDENKRNNKASNLEWCNVSYNNNYGTRIQRVIESKINGKKSQPVIQKKNGLVIATFPSLRQVERSLGYNKRLISACCKGIYKQAYGYEWEYGYAKAKDLLVLELDGI